jgi:hypothetical protein
VEDGRGGLGDIVVCRVDGVVVETVDFGNSNFLVGGVVEMIDRASSTLPSFDVTEQALSIRDWKSMPPPSSSYLYLKTTLIDREDTLSNLEFQ